MAELCARRRAPRVVLPGASRTSGARALPARPGLGGVQIGPAGLALVAVDEVGRADLPHEAEDGQRRRPVLERGPR